MRPRTKAVGNRVFSLDITSFNMVEFTKLFGKIPLVPGYSISQRRLAYSDEWDRITIRFGGGKQWFVAAALFFSQL